MQLAKIKVLGSNPKKGHLFFEVVEDNDSIQKMFVLKTSIQTSIH